LGRLAIIKVFQNFILDNYFQTEDYEEIKAEVQPDVYQGNYNLSTTFHPVSM